MTQPTTRDRSCGAGPTALVMLAISAGCAMPDALPEPQQMVLETEPLRIERIYGSMMGPFDWQKMDYADLDWVTGVRSEVLDADTKEKMGDEFFCHSQIQASYAHWLVMATGASEIRFPRGFGIELGKEMSRGASPIERELRFLGMVLNNHEPYIDRSAIVRTTIDYHRDEDVGERLKNLYKVGLTMRVQNLEEWQPGTTREESDPDFTSHCAYVKGDPDHWYVPPGRQVTRRQIFEIIPVESGRVHYVGAHMHNFGRYMRLTDRTTGELVWQADVEYEADRDQIVNISNYSSEDGFPIYRDHEYEIEALYDNTTSREVDAMAMMYLYYHPDGTAEVLLNEMER